MRGVILADAEDAGRVRNGRQVGDFVQRHSFARCRGAGASRQVVLADCGFQGGFTMAQVRYDPAIHQAPARFVIVQVRDETHVSFHS